MGETVTGPSRRHMTFAAEIQYLSVLFLNLKDNKKIGGRNLFRIFLMSLSLASLPVCAAVSPLLPLNFVTRKRASVHGNGIDEATFSMELLVTVTFLNRAATVILPFTIVDQDLGFEVILGSQWDTWCDQNKGGYCIPFFVVVIRLIVLVPCPLSVVDVPPDFYNDFSSRNLHFNDMCQSGSTTAHLQSHQHSSTAVDPSSSSSVTEHEAQSIPISAHAILHDMFLSRRVTGIQASVFHCLEAQLCKICLLHGLQVDIACPPRDMKCTIFSTVTASQSDVRILHLPRL